MYPSKKNEGHEAFYINIGLHQGFACPFHFNGLKELTQFTQYDLPQCKLDKPLDLTEWIFNILIACRTIGILKRHLIQIEKRNRQENHILPLGTQTISLTPLS